MSDRTSDIVYNVTGQIVELYPPELETTPSSAGAKVFDAAAGDDDDAEFTPSVTVEAVSTTVSSACGYSSSNRCRINVTSSTGMVVGHNVLLYNSLGQYESPTIRAVGPTYADAEDPLQYDYAAADTVKGARLYFTVDSTWVADEQNVLDGDDAPYRVRWTYTVNAIPRVYVTYLRLVRKAFKHGVTIRDLQERWATLWAEQPASAGTRRAAGLISIAAERVRFDLLGRGIQPNTISDTALIDELIRARCFVEAGLAGDAPQGWDVPAWTALMMTEYNSMFAARLQAMQTAQDKGTDGSIVQAPSPQPRFVV
jgi:hypothetical protein